MISAVSGSSGYSYYSYGASLRTQKNPQQGLQQANQVQNERIGGSQASGRIVGAQKAAQTGVPVQPVEPASPVSVEGARHIDAALPSQQAADPTELANRMRVQYAEGVRPSDSAGQVQGLAKELSAESAKGVGSATNIGKAFDVSEGIENAGRMDPAELSARMRIQYGETGVQGLNKERNLINPAAQSARPLAGSSMNNVKDLSRVSQPATEGKQGLEIQDQQEKNVQKVQNDQNEQKVQVAQKEAVPAFAAA